MTRTFASLLVLCCALALLLPGSSTAQNDPAAESPAAATETVTKDYRGPLPDYFGKLGIGDEQRKQLYAIDGDYARQIQTLEKQIAGLEAERDAKLEALLTPGQKLRLKELREEAARRAAAEAEKTQASDTIRQN